MTGGKLSCLDTQPVYASTTKYWATVFLLLSWLVLNWTNLGWLVQTVRELSPSNQSMLLVGGGILAFWMVRQRQSFYLSAVPSLRWGALFLLASSVLGMIVVDWLLILDQVPIVFALLGTYGLLGLFWQSATWHKGLPLAIAVSLMVPFGLQFSSGLGFPARILTAHVVEFFLKQWHVAALSSEDIIVLDTGIARVDLPCSGLKSLWTGTLFLLALTWLEQRRFGLAWLSVFIANFGALVIANIARVLTVVLIAKVWNQSALAEMLHVPLGVLMFVAACGLTLGLLRWVPRQTPPTQPEPESCNHVSPTKFSLILSVCFLGLTLMPHPPATILPAAITQLHWSLPAQVEAIPLTAIEQDFFASHPDVLARKQRFAYQGLTGSVLLVASPSLQRHHAPELCLIGSGLHLDRIASQQFASGLAARWLSLNHQKSTAIYWFQSPQQTTADFLTRFWLEASRQQSAWTLVSILFDQFYAPDDPKLQAVVTDVYRSLNQTLKQA